jgi:Tol biopolymer transport system component
MERSTGWRTGACVAAALAIALGSIHAWADMETPAWSPDGNRIAFATTRYAEGYAEIGPSGVETDHYVYDDAIYVCDLTLSEAQPKRLVEGVGPKWSPDGTTIAYTKLLKDGSELWLADATGGRAPRRFGTQKLTALVIWSPDGSKLLLAPPAKFDFPGVAGTYDGSRASVGDIATGAISPVGPEHFSSNGGAWSPDGKRLALSLWQMAEGNRKVHEIVVVPQSGGAGQTIFRDVEDGGRYLFLMSPQWDPKGRSICVLSMERQLRKPEGASMPVDAAVAVDVLLLSPDGATRKTVHDEPVEFAKPFEYSTPVYSPDGKHLAFTMNGHTYVADVADSGTDTISKREVPLYGKLPEGKMLGALAWYPTGSAIATAWLTPTAWQIWLFQPDGSNVQRIARVQRPK